MDLERDRSGLTTYNVMDQRRSLATVLTAAGVHTTVVIATMCQSHAPTAHLWLRSRRRLSVVWHSFISHRYFVLCLHYKSQLLGNRWWQYVLFRCSTGSNFSVLFCWMFYPKCKYIRTCKSRHTFKPTHIEICVVRRHIVHRGNKHIGVTISGSVGFWLTNCWLRLGILS